VNCAPARSPRGLPGVVANTPAHTVCEALKHHGLLQPSLVARFDAVRKRRNAWLHSGADPSESEAVEAMQTAAELFRLALPSLSLRPTSNWLIL